MGKGNGRWIGFKRIFLAVPHEFINAGMISELPDKKLYLQTKREIIKVENIINQAWHIISVAQIAIDRGQELLKLYDRIERRVGK